MLLTKSKYLAGLKCPRYMWLLINDVDKLPEHNIATKFIFKQGNEIGQLAKTIYPEGMDIQEDDFVQNLNLTKYLLTKNKILFEAGIKYKEIYARADILMPVGEGWNIIEVKSGTKVKDEHIDDLAFQKYVYEKAGLKINKCFLMHVNNQYIKQGEITSDILEKEDLTEKVNERIKEVPTNIDRLLNIAKNPEPDINILTGCNNGLKCDSKACHAFLPEGHIFELTRGGKTTYELLEANIIALKDIPEEFELKTNHHIQANCAKNNKTYLNKEKLKQFLKTITEPTYYMDFETFAPAIPIYNNTKPYEKIPFQFSVHKVENNKTTHKEFLAKDLKDPREEFLKQLKSALGTKGSIIVYYESFEKGILTHLAENFPEYKEWISSLMPRIVDLIVPFNNLYYYNPKQKGKSSIKVVLPAITGKGYENMDIADGQTASVAFYTNPEDKTTRDNLLKYCGLDTEAMVWIIDELKKLISE